MSGNFKFRLERLFNKTEREKQKTEEKLNNLKFNYEKYNGINKGESLVYQKIKRNYLFALDKGITETEKNLTIKLKELDIRREDLIKKQIERKTVDILKERKSLEFYKEEERKDQIFNDELALYAYMRKY